MHFPLTLARLAIATYRLERRLTLDGAMSAPILPTRGILAGCSAALALLKVSMIRSLDEFITRHPRVDLEVYVDDAELQAIGPKHTVVECIADAANDMANILEARRGHPLADEKATLMATCSTAAAKIRSRTSGRAGKFTGVAEKLGVEYRCRRGRTSKGGIRRGRFVQQHRKQKRLDRLLGMGGPARVVADRGILPAIAFGNEVHGMDDVELWRVRRLVGRARTPNTRGTSLTLKLMLEGDPGVKAAEGPILHWAAAAWRAVGPKAAKRPRDPTIGALTSGMNEALKTAAGGYDWKQVGGPAMAMLLTCLRIGWNVLSAFRITDERGSEWDFGTVGPSEFRSLIARAVNREASKRMAEKLGREDLSDGIWVAPVRTALNDRSLSPEARSSLRRAFCSGDWSTDRRFAAGLTPERRCRCGALVDDTYHRVWECSDLDELRLHHTTEAMRAAAAGAARDDLLWTRGIIAEPWKNLIPPRDDHAETVYPEGAVLWDSPGSGCYIDGSALHPTHPEARRAGWSVLELAVDGTVAAAVFGHVPHGLSSGQAAAAGEMHAARRALELWPGLHKFYTDYQACADGVESGGVIDNPRRCNAAAWRAISRALDGNAVEAVKVKAHKSLAAAEAEGEEALHHKRGNDAADAFAKRGAAAHGGVAACDAYAEAQREHTRLCRWIGLALSQWKPIIKARKQSGWTARSRAEQAARRKRAVEQGGHNLTSHGEGLMCTHCGKRAQTARGVEALRRSCCEPEVALRIPEQSGAPSDHKLWLSAYDTTAVGEKGAQVVWCSVCGAYSTRRLHRLKLACTGCPDASAKQRLNHLQNCRHPVHGYPLTRPLRLTERAVAILRYGADLTAAAFAEELRGRRGTEGESATAAQNPRGVEGLGDGAESATPQGNETRGARYEGTNQEIEGQRLHEGMQDLPDQGLPEAPQDGLFHIGDGPEDDEDVFGHGGCLDEAATSAAALEPAAEDADAADADDAVENEAPSKRRRLRGKQHSDCARFRRPRDAAGDRDQGEDGPLSKAAKVAECGGSLRTAAAGAGTVSPARTVAARAREWLTDPPQSVRRVRLRQSSVDESPRDEGQPQCIMPAPPSHVHSDAPSVAVPASGAVHIARPSSDVPPAASRHVHRSPRESRLASSHNAHSGEAVHPCGTPATAPAPAVNDHEDERAYVPESRSVGSGPPPKRRRIVSKSPAASAAARPRVAEQAAPEWPAEGVG